MLPKVNRILPEIGSRPTIASRRPTKRMISPFVIEPPERVTARRSPSVVRAKYSGGPKSRANSASGGAKNVRPTTATVPAINDPIAAIPRAAPARPFLAIW